MTTPASLDTFGGVDIGFYQLSGFDSSHMDDVMLNILRLRASVYGEELGWTCSDMFDGNDLEYDDYDSASTHIGLVDYSGINDNPVFATLRFIGRPTMDDRLPCEEAFDLNLDPNEHRFELSRFIARHSINKLQAFGSFVISCFAVGFLVKNNAVGYAILERPLIRHIRRFGLDVERCSEFKTFSEYGDTENCVVRIHGSGSIDRAGEILRRIPDYPNLGFFELASASTGQDLAGQMYKYFLAKGGLGECRRI